MNSSDDSGSSWRRGVWIGAVAGGVVGGLVGLAFNNVINENRLNVGMPTVVGVGTGVILGALVGGGIDWLIEP